MKKLSELPNDMELSVGESGVPYTVEELKKEIIELGEPHHNETWYIIKTKRWKPDARKMAEEYIEYEYDDMYEDWDERARDCLTDEHLNKIQAILDDAFKGDSATVYWEEVEPIEIDIFPTED